MDQEVFAQIGSIHPFVKKQLETKFVANQQLSLILPRTKEIFLSIYPGLQNTFFWQTGRDNPKPELMARESVSAGRREIKCERRQLEAELNKFLNIIVRKTAKKLKYENKPTFWRDLSSHVLPSRQNVLRYKLRDLRANCHVRAAWLYGEKTRENILIYILNYQVPSKFAIVRQFGVFPSSAAPLGQYATGKYFDSKFPRH